MAGALRFGIIVRRHNQKADGFHQRHCTETKAIIAVKNTNKAAHSYRISARRPMLGMMAALARSIIRLQIKK